MGNWLMLLSDVMVYGFAIDCVEFLLVGEAISVWCVFGVLIRDNTAKSRVCAGIDSYLVAMNVPTSSHNHSSDDQPNALMGLMGMLKYVCIERICPLLERMIRNNRIHFWNPMLFLPECILEPSLEVVGPGEL